MNRIEIDTIISIDIKINKYLFNKLKLKTIQYGVKRDYIS